MKDEKVCPIDNCEKEFANPGSLVRHIGSTHGKVKTPIFSNLIHPFFFNFHSIPIQVVDILQQQGFEVPEYLCAKDGKLRQVEMSLKKVRVEKEISEEPAKLKEHLAQVRTS